MENKFKVHTKREYKTASTSAANFKYTWVSLDMSEEEAVRYKKHQERYPIGLISVEIKSVHNKESVLRGLEQAKKGDLKKNIINLDNNK